MLLHQIHDRFHARIKDPEYWTDTLATALANDCLLSISAHFGITKTPAYTQLTTVESQKQYTPPVGFIANELLHYDDGYNQDITFLNSPKEVYGVVTDPDEESNPIYAYFWPTDAREELWFYPVPNDEYTMDWFYWSIPSTLVNDNDTPYINTIFHTYIVDYMVWRSKVNDDEDGMNEGTFEALWNGRLGDMQAGTINQLITTRWPKPGGGKGLFPSDAASSFSVRLADPTGKYIW